jgi:uncharacterized membrane protein
VIALGLDTLGSLVLTAYAVAAAVRLLSGTRLELILLQVASGIRVGLTFKIAATLLALSQQPGLAALARVGVIVAVRLLIRSRTAEAANRLSRRPAA